MRKGSKHKPETIQKFIKRTVADRFWEKVDKSGECWLWTGAVTKRGYGCIWVNRANIAAHRFSYESNVGPIHAGLVVCHKCDVPTCVRPDHLFVGTLSDNSQDCVRKGRLKPHGLPMLKVRASYVQGV